MSVVEMNAQKNIDELIAHQPNPEDPSDKRITDLIRKELASTSWAKQTFQDIHDLLVSYYRDALGHVDQTPDYIHDRTQKVLSEISTRTNSKVVLGEENIDMIRSQSPVFLVTNHLGAYKLANIKPKEELGITNGLESMHALPLFFGALKPVADKLGDNLYIAAYEFPGEIGLLQKSAGWIVMPLTGDGRVDYLHQATLEMIRSHSNSALVVLPEGGTSGKRNEGGPYDLEPFKRGSFAIAGDLRITVLPVAQYFNPNEGKGFELAVFPPFTSISPKDIEESKEYYGELAEKTRNTMQAWLDTRKSS